MKKRTKRICSVLLIVALCIAGLPWAAVHGEFEVPQAETENAVLTTETEESTVQAEAADDNNALQTGLSEDTAQEGNGGAVSADEAVADTAEAFDAEDVDYIETYEQENPTAEQEEESDGGKASATEAEEAAGTKTDEAATVATDGTAVTEADETTAADSTEAVTAESDDVTEVQQEQQEWLPAKTLDMETEDGIGVTIAFGDNVFPAGTTVRLDDIPRDEAMENLSGAVDGIIVDAVGVDISFHNDAGEEVQPAGDVNVSLILKTPLLDGDEQTVVHIGHDGTATELSSSDVQEVSVDGAEFVASSFSGYGVASVIAISDSVVYDEDWLKANYNYEESTNTITLTGYKGGGGATIVPSGIEMDNGKTYTTVLGAASTTKGIWTGSDVTSLAFAPGVKFSGNDLQSLFYGMSNLQTLDLSNINTSNVIKMQNMFKDCYKLETLVLDDGFDTSSVTNMSGMFANCGKLVDLNLSKFDTANVEYMQSMFADCEELGSIDISSFNTSNVKNMERMFGGCNKLTELKWNSEIFNTSNVTDMSNMFQDCKILGSLDVKGFNTSKVTNMSGMFQNCSSVTELGVDGANFKTSSVEDMSNMFSGCSGLISLPVGNFNTSKVTNMSGMFQNCSGLRSLDVSNFATYNTTESKGVTDMSKMFKGCEELTNLNVNNFNTLGVTNMSEMFKGCKGLTELTWNDSLFITSNVTDMGGMFSDCEQLESIKINGFSTSNVTDMVEMFKDCKELTELTWDNSKFITSNVVDMSGMFSGCEKLTSLDVSSFNTGKVGNSREIKVGDTVTVKTGSMANMFSGCSSLKSLNVDSFNTSNVTNMTGMFMNCSSLKSKGVQIDDTDASVVSEFGVSKFNTKNVQNITSMFVGCDSLTTLDLSGFDLSGLTVGGKIFPEGEGVEGYEPLGEIKSPTNLERTIPLPKVKYYDSSNGETAENATSYYKNLPQKQEIGEDESIVLRPLKNPVTDVTLEPEITESTKIESDVLILDISSEIQNTATLIATVSPENAFETGVDKEKWESSADNAVVKVEEFPKTSDKEDDENDYENGNVWRAKVTAVGTGETTITVTTLGKAENGEPLTASYKVKVIASVKELEVFPKEFTLYKDSREEIGETKQLTATVSPSGVREEDKEIVWKSNNESIATVDEKTGLVTARGIGEVIITATTKGTKADSDEHCMGECKITVKVVEHVTGISLDESEMLLYTNKIPMNKSLTATITPSNATYKNVLWSSSDDSVATVSGSGENNLNGTVIAKKAGTTTIRAISEDNAKIYAECEVTVEVAVESVSLSPTLYLYKGEDEPLTAEVKPSNATNQNVSWESSDENVATVDENGNVTAVKAGTATITVTTEDGEKTASCVVTVTGYAVEVVDNRTNPDEEHIRAGVSYMRGDSYLVIEDVDEENSKIIPLIEADSSLSPTTYYVCDMSLMSEKTGGSAVKNFGNCFVRMPLPESMPLSGGSVQVVSVLTDDDGTLSLDKNIQFQTMVIDGKDYMRFDTTQFTEYAILYTVPQAPSQPSSSGVVRSSGGSSSSGSVSVRRSSSSSSSSSSVVEKASPKFTKVYWRADEKSTFYWKYGKKATGYRLEYSSDGKFKKTATQSVGRKKKNGTIKGLKVGKTYYVRVKAYKKTKSGKKEWSAWSHRIVVKRKR